ncbi:hypothetical protein PIB30_065986 [Stylosanthes scabra]|uniref:Uncharacterized protein n=1 Tax=Stylosanthes scabra TaxID=79078 RepID=A0ABU6QMM5_9FABA|nr:hypothetical protein [Stylosanthes scabra]
MPEVYFEEGLVKKISEADAVSLECMPSVEEIQATMWSCEPTRASGLDGYNMGFIRKTWDTIDGEFSAMVGKVFEEAKLPVERQILDGALIAYETVAWPRRSKKAGVTVKLDLKKSMIQCNGASLIACWFEWGLGRNG